MTNNHASLFKGQLDTGFTSHAQAVLETSNLQARTGGRVGADGEQAGGCLPAVHPGQAAGFPGPAGQHPGVPGGSHGRRLEGSPREGAHQAGPGQDHPGAGV